MKKLDYDSGEDIANAIDKRIERVAKEIYQNSPYNKIKYGVVKNVNDKQYTVQINGINYSNVYALKNVGTINVNDSVVLIIPDNNISQMFILGIIDE